MARRAYEWGPDFQCPDCGTIVAYRAYGSAVRELREFTPYGSLPHECRPAQRVRLASIRECVCGVQVAGDVEVQNKERHVCPGPKVDRSRWPAHPLTVTDATIMAGKVAQRLADNGIERQMSVRGGQ